ncbi:MAG: hypothetical protein A3F22_00605 [Candidatus Magasanikbacteria bacterium RIFCSPHIGHO2_12_FULL_41_16]|nr:MAG: hypothetical protein A3F22_00605 [Candidatus Magasanikbacteria bacterium RIFCSPHIGHO2_12_FULL_41_16]
MFDIKLKIIYNHFILISFEICRNVPINQKRENVPRLTVLDLEWKPRMAVLFSLVVEPKVVRNLR